MTTVLLNKSAFLLPKADHSLVFFFLQEICPHPVLGKALGKEDVKRNQVKQLQICKSLFLFY